MKAEIADIFCSIQGEGLYAGQKQVFVRFAGCNLGCSYCDEPAAYQPPAASHQEGRKSRRNGSDCGKMSATAAAGAALKLARKNRVKAVSLTGGEPLLNWEFIKEMAPVLRKAGLTVHLETNGVLYRELDKVKYLTDVIAMDIKPPSSTGGRAFWREHALFIKAAPEKTFVKVVVASETSGAEFKKAVSVAAGARRSVPFFIQPVTPNGRIKPPSWKRLDVFYRAASANLETVRILPQMHKLWGIK